MTANGFFAWSISRTNRRASSFIRSSYATCRHSAHHPEAAQHRTLPPLLPQSRLVQEFCLPCPYVARPGSAPPSGSAESFGHLAARGTCEVPLTQIVQRRRSLKLPVEFPSDLPLLSSIDGLSA